jgi:hypothetical protein
MIKAAEIISGFFFSIPDTTFNLSKNGFYKADA